MKELSTLLFHCVCLAQGRGKLTSGGGRKLRERQTYLIQDWVKTYGGRQCLPLRRLGVGNALFAALPPPHLKLLLVLVPIDFTFYYG